MAHDSTTDGTRPGSATAIILAGGRSSRMGTPKALLPFAGEPLIVHLVRTLHSRFNRVVVVAARDQELPPLQASVIHDDVAHQGPVAGISYGLRVVDGDIAFVTGCDSPFLSMPLIAYMLEQTDGYEAGMPEWDGRLQPLMAVYRTSVRPLLEAQLAAGELRLLTLADRIRVRRVREAEIRRFDPDGASFFNMNEPHDYAAALERWQNGH